MNEQQQANLTEQLFWRDEILQAMYWMRGEGLGETLSARSLSGLLDARQERLDAELQRLADEQYIEALGVDQYRLTSLGIETGKRSFSDEFADITGSAHGACGPGCDCHRHPSLAAACRAAR
ncbi:MAG: hypothetical protein ACR2PL_23475 [Dehalococcoidia bacterium]